MFLSSHKLARCLTLLRFALIYGFPACDAFEVLGSLACRPSKCFMRVVDGVVNKSDINPLISGICRDIFESKYHH